MTLLVNDINERIMKIKVPSNCVYYYECSRNKARLLYWIPPIVMNGLIREGRVKGEIVRDYPFGLDIWVSSDVFEEYREKYWLVLDIDPDAVWRAFLSLWLKETQSYMGVGYINEDFLNFLFIKSTAASVRKRKRLTINALRALI